MSRSSVLATTLFVVATSTLVVPAFAQTPAPAPAPAAAADAKPAEPAGPFTITGNFGVYSQYIFRGLTQTDREPAFQGGFDLAHSSGFYAGTWGSNISWLHDAGVCEHGCSLEWDMYGGYKYAFNDDWGLDGGVLYYYYPGHYFSGVTKPNTTELYLAGNWKWVSLKYSHSVDDTFGVANSNNSWYLDLSANYPITDTLTANAHVGRQEYKGSSSGVSNDIFNYTDWKLGVTWAVMGFNVGAYYTDTNAKDVAYTLAGRNIGKATGTVFVQKTF
jgi:uncharacterized protein (TIGR02001 family)